MAYRTTVKTLRILVANLNTYCGLPVEAWRREGDRYVAIPGCFVLDCAYGGYRLSQMLTENGGERDITPRYPAGVAAELIRAYMRGLQAAHPMNTKLAA
jgi:hypothetical protein